MKILEQALNKIKSIHKKQYIFFISLIQGLIGIAGKRTFRNLARYIQIDEHTFARQMKKEFDFIGLNMHMIEAIKDKDEIAIAAQDASFMPKAGKKTYGLARFWNGVANKVEKGLELDVISIVKLGEKKECYTISAQQTPASSEEKAKRKKQSVSKIDFYIAHVKKALSALIALDIKYIVVDAFFAKNKYINQVTSLGLHVISKLRIDARLRRIYTGPQKARGRKKKFDTGNVCADDFKDSTVTTIDTDKIELRSCIAHSVSLGRLIKVILVRKQIDENNYGKAYLFSTDLQLSDLNIYKFYVARFQIEFVFRDAKNFTGLGDCQSRDAQRLHYHFNASLTALNVAKIQDSEIQKTSKTTRPFSMASWSRKYHVDIVINRFISMFGFDQTLIKLHPNYNQFLQFGSIHY